MRVFRKARFVIGRLALALATSLQQPAWISLSERQHLEQQMSRELRVQREKLEAVLALVAQFQSEYSQVIALLERTVRELVRQPNTTGQLDTSKRYTLLFAEKDRRLFARWKEIKRAMERL